ncbi:MAG: OmpH family outer membrane protein [Candidatus Omnitrophica bacterium]|nr:OmpH family outer membrane protein [Candidatus Omnitrophota bacterium]
MVKVKVLILVVALMLGFCSFSEYAQAADAVKIAYIDVASVFDSYDKTKDEDAALGKKSETKQKERERVVEKIRNSKSELELLGEKQREKKQAQIDEEIRKLQDFDREAKTELRRERDTMVREILKEIDVVIKDYAKKNGYTIVLNSRILVYAEEGYDITREIVNILNSRYRRKK